MATFDIPLSLFTEDELKTLERCMATVNYWNQENDDPTPATVLDGLRYALRALENSEDETAEALRQLREMDAARRSAAKTEGE